MKNRELTLGIDASRNRSGGAIAHLIGILEKFDMHEDVECVHVWVSDSLSNRLPNYSWLIKHTPPYLEKSLMHQLWWQFRYLHKEAKLLGCNIMFATDASTLCKFRPLVVLSQDLLSYEPGALKSYRWGKARLRLEVIKHIQNFAFRRSAGVLFLTEYARRIVQLSSGKLKNTSLAPHGVDDIFREVSRKSNETFPSSGEEVQCVYVSNTEWYKNQWNVVRGIKILRDEGFPIKLTLIGGGSGKSQELLNKAITECDGSNWISQLSFLGHNEIPQYLDKADIFIFASSCENLPVTLLEGMAAGLPIACSDSGPMPEVLRDGGLYFDPLEPQSIADAVKKIIQSSDLREEIVQKARQRSEDFTWEKCSRSTFEFIRHSFYIYEKMK